MGNVSAAFHRDLYLQKTLKIKNFQSLYWHTRHTLHVIFLYGDFACLTSIMYLSVLWCVVVWVNTVVGVGMIYWNSRIPVFGCIALLWELLLSMGLPEEQHFLVKMLSHDSCGSSQSKLHLHVSKIFLTEPHSLSNSDGPVAASFSTIAPKTLLHWSLPTVSAPISRLI